VDASDARFGSDRTGLLCGYRFAADEAGQPIDVDTASAVLAALDGTGAPDGRFFWLHFNLANQASQRWLRQHLALPDDFHALLEPSRSTRAEVAGDAVVAVINDATLFGVDTTDISTMAVYVTDGLLVSARRTPLRSADRLREEVKAGERFASPIDLLAHFLRHQADMLRDTAASTAARVDVIEDHVMANDVSGQRATLGALRRVLVRLQRLIAPEPSAMFRLVGHPPAWLTQADVDALRASAEALAAAVADCAALLDRIRLLQEELFAVVNEQTNRTLFVLTVVTTLALPMTIIPGLFGMNVGGIPLGTHHLGFATIAALTVSVAGLGALVVFRRFRR
jgi:zinc transporter